jgi:hypothetical protein
LRLLAPFCLGSLALLVCSLIASADLIPVGYLSYNVTVPGALAEFDIANQTGPNSTTFPDTTWPVATAVPFKISSLTVDFRDGSSTMFGPSYFTLGPDGLSLDGSSIDISGSNPQPTEAVLAGTFTNSNFALNDAFLVGVVVPPGALANSTGTGNPAIVHPAGSCSSGPSTGCLQDGDLAVIYVAAKVGPPVPEPASWEPAIWILLLTGTLVSRAIRKIQ